MERRTLAIVLGALLAGCAQPAIPPSPTVDEPNNPNAVETPLPARSRTLAPDDPSVRASVGTNIRTEGQSND